MSKGFENVDSDTFAIPYLSILHSNSKQAQKKMPEYIQGAEAGMFANFVSKKLYDGDVGVKFIQCAYIKKYTEWAPRHAGGGFVAMYTAAQFAAMREKDEIIEKRGQYTKGENSILDTREHYGFIVEDDGSLSQVLLTLKSTQLKKSKQIMSLLRMARDEQGNARDIWGTVLRLKTIPESNEHGSWYGIAVESEGASDRALHAEAEAFHDSIVTLEGNQSFKISSTEKLEDHPLF